MTAGLSAGLEGFLPTSQVLASKPFEGLWNALLQIVDAALPIEIGS